MAATERPLRRDAEHNRRRIVAAARELFADAGLEVSMEGIARRAGVGIATLYRRFPTRESLIDALFEDRLDALEAAAEAALRDPSPWDGLAGFLEELSASQAADRGLKQLMISTAHGRGAIARSRERLAPVVERIVARAVRDGELRDDFAPSDVLLLSVMLGAVAEYTQGVAPEAWRRCLGIALDGLRRRRDAPTPLPRPALTTAELDAAMAARRAG